MIRGFALLLVLLWASQVQAQSVVINSGEHATFSRLVFPAAENVTYRVVSNKRKVRVKLEGFSQKFDLSRVFDRIPKTRLLSIEQQQGRESAELSLNLACDCLGLAYRMNQYLVIDVIDSNDERFASPDVETANNVAPDAPENEQTNAGESAPSLEGRPQPRKPKANTEVSEETEQVMNPPLMEPEPLPEVAADPPEETTQVTQDEDSSLAQVEEARRSLVKQLELAAEQGLVALSEPTEEPSSNPEMEVSENVLADELKALSLEMQSGGSVRIRQPKQVQRGVPEPVEAEDTPDIMNCIPDTRLDPENWADDRSFNAQLVALRVDLLGEFDQPNAPELEKLVKFYLHYGLAIEAQQLLRSYMVFGVRLPLRLSILPTVKMKTPS